MLGRYVWPLLALVGAVHFFLLQVFFSAGGGAQSTDGKRTQLSLALIERLPPPAVAAENTEPPKLQSSPPSADSRSPPPSTPNQTPEQALPPQQPVQGSRVNPAFDRSKFLDFDAVDQSAINTSEFEPTLIKVLPTRFDSIVLELLIDETGRTVKVACIEGDCPAEADDGLQQLLVVPFLPAIKNGQPVASRKVIQISPTPTFGL